MALPPPMPTLLRRLVLVCAAVVGSVLDWLPRSGSLRLREGERKGREGVVSAGWG